ncbi:MAG: hypothetical protein Kow0069_19670 [Promethearchaeota archaeon]
MALAVTLAAVAAVAYERYGAQLTASYVPIVWIALAFLGGLVATGAYSLASAVVQATGSRRGGDREGAPASPAGWRRWARALDSAWHVLLGLALLGAPVALVVLLGGEITPEYAGLAAGLGVALVGYGASFLAGGLKSLAAALKKVPARPLPGLKATGLLFLALIPAVGGYYYAGVYLPDQKFRDPRDWGPILTWSDDPSTSVVVSWTSVAGGAFELKYGTDPAALDATATPQASAVYQPSGGAWGEGEVWGTHYVVELHGLAPNTTYYYAIPGFRDQVTPFRTAPPPPGAFSFQVIGDTRRPDSQHRRLVELMANYPADFVVNVGDTCNNALLDWNQFFWEVRDQADRRPYVVAVGNHEYGDEFGYYFHYANTPGHYYYSFNYSNAHFLVIDPFDGGDAYHAISTEQLQFVEEDLARNAGKHDWVVAAFHVPIYSTGDFNYNQDLERDLMPLFTKYGVDLVLTGHDHHYESFYFPRSLLEEKFGAYGSTGAGMMHFVSGGGGAPLDVALVTQRAVEPWGALHHNSSVPGENWQKYFPKGSTPAEANWTVADVQVYGELTYQFIQIEVSGPTMTLESLRVDGSTIETFTLAKGA